MCVCDEDMGSTLTIDLTTRTSMFPPMSALTGANAVEFSVSAVEDTNLIYYLIECALRV